MRESGFLSTEGFRAPYRLPKLATGAASIAFSDTFALPGRGFGLVPDDARLAIIGTNSHWHADTGGEQAITFAGDPPGGVLSCPRVVSMIHFFVMLATARWALKALAACERYGARRLDTPGAQRNR